MPCMRPCYCWDWETYIIVQVSNGLLACVDVLDFNLFVKPKNTKEGKGFPKGLLSREGKGLLVYLRNIFNKEIECSWCFFWLEEEGVCMVKTSIGEVVG